MRRKDLGEREKKHLYFVCFGEVLLAVGLKEKCVTETTTLFLLSGFPPPILLLHLIYNPIGALNIYTCKYKLNRGSTNS